ncbi:TIGR00266 family protein [Thiolinea disciformis]|uniref:TIGR00266 family protein n=1 Tax=Thiolinea disciformis TaxID=125614 RepID=UPI00036A42E8|nr:TIGR00266 family protein [Thiolinea disciformis]
MTTFTVTGEVDPFLHVSLKKGDKIYCESGSMVMMEATLDLQGKMSGGLGQALIRRFANGESFFQQHIEATRSDGDCLLSPALPGAEVVTVGEAQYILNDGAFVAATSDVILQVRTQNVGNALFGQSGGFFVMETAGKGQLVVSGFGTIFSLDVEPNKDLIIDNAHVVCWDRQLHNATTSANGLRGQHMLMMRLSFALSSKVPYIITLMVNH